MRSSNRGVKNPRSTMGRILMALVLVFAIGAVSMAPPAFGREHRGHHWRHYGHRPYGYYYGYPYRPYGYYYYPPPAYAPPPVVYAPPPPPPGVTFVFPLRIR